LVLKHGGDTCRQLLSLEGTARGGRPLLSMGLDRISSTSDLGVLHVGIPTQLQGGWKGCLPDDPILVIGRQGCYLSTKRTFTPGMRVTYIIKDEGTGCCYSEEKKSPSLRGVAWDRTAVREKPKKKKLKRIPPNLHIA